MIVKRLFTVFLGLFILVNPYLISQASQNSLDLLVSTDWLADKFNDSSLVILHYGMKSAFKKEHIPGARYVDIWELLDKNEEGIRHELPDEQDLEEAFRSFGINNNSTIIICYENGNAIPMAARLFFTLEYAGLNRVALLNGGLKAWKDEDRLLTERETIPKKGKVDIQILPDVRVNKEDVKTSLTKDDVILIDARPPERYYGNETDQNSSRQGHISGAVNLPYYKLTRDDSPHLFKEDVDLRKLFADRNIVEESTIIVYCGTGIWASPVYYIARYLGYKVRFYDGSYQEWSEDTLLPVSR